ncbi:MAG: ribose-phosphate pyrophosphokinase [Lachnospirales bacterium]
MSNDSVAKGDLGIIVLKSAKDLGNKINSKIAKVRDESESYLIDGSDVRFSNGEGKVSLTSSVRGKDIYILCDIGNYSCTYNLYGIENRMGPDEHFQDIKRTLSAIAGKAARTTVIMPILYASRQHRRKGRESLDCAMALQELEKMGVSDIITFDVHDPNIQNAVPLVSFENIYPTYDIVKTMIENESDWLDDLENTVVIAPDTGAMDRAIYYAGVLGLNVGMFYKRRDYSKVVNGKNPIVAHEYMGQDIRGMNVLVVDDMIASGESSLDIAREVKGRGAKKVYIASTFALFTEGVQKFEEHFEQGIIDRVYSTNLTYIPEGCRDKEWHCTVDLSGYIAKIVNTLNHDSSISGLLDATPGIKKLLQKHKNNK